MRPFPRAGYRRLAAACLAATLLIGSAGSVSAHDDDLKNKKNKVDKQVEHADEALDHSSKRLQNATSRLTQAKQDLSAAQAHLVDVQTRLDSARSAHDLAESELAQAEADLVVAEDDLAEGEQDVADQREIVADTASDSFQEGDPDLVALQALVNAESLSDVASGEQAKDALLSAEKSSYDDLRAAEVLLDVRKERVETLRDKKDTKEQEAADHLADMQSLTDQARDARADVAALVGERKTARADAESARDADRAELRRLEKEQARLEQQLKDRAAALSKQGKGIKAPANGFLSAPVNGPVTSPFGYREHPIYHYWGLHDGIDYGGGCGIPIRAAADGKVMQSFWSDVYGNRMVVDHGLVSGKGLATIYNHATRYTVSPGQQVSRGQVIGYSGDTGWSTACHLHFTVMENGGAVNPLSWM